MLIESDLEEAKRLSDDGYQAIHGDPEEASDLERASIGAASLIVADASERTASVVLTALEANAGLRTVAITASPRHAPAFTELGVDRSVAPHALIGRRLADKATTPVTVDAPGDETADVDSVAVRELLVRRNSPLHGVRIGDAGLTEHSELTIVAGWFDGELRLSPAAETRLTSNTVLVVAGPERAISDATADISDVRTPRSERHALVVVAGYGEGGRAAEEALSDDVSVTTVDESPGRGSPDIVGDVTEPETLREAGIDDASALLVTVDDATALLTAATARSLSDDVEILLRVTDADKTSSAFRAGADYVLSVQRACARLVAAEIHGERVLDPAGQIRLVRADAAPFVGTSLSAAQENDDADWTVVGVIHDGTVETDERTAVESGDDVIVAGSDEAIGEFERSVGGNW